MLGSAVAPLEAEVPEASEGAEPFEDDPPDADEAAEPVTVDSVELELSEDPPPQPGNTSATAASTRMTPVLATFANVATKR